MELVFRRSLALLFLTLLVSGVSVPKAWSEQGSTEPFDHSAWGQFLTKYVSPEGLVDYQGVKTSPELLNDYLDKVQSVPSILSMGEWPREENLAFFLNVYHAAVIKQIADAYPIKSIQDIPGVWDLAVIRIGKIKISINDIRSKFLIQNFRDEKIDTVLACGAKSCPRLVPEAFTGPRVEGQLYLRARKFVNDPTYNMVIPGKKEIRIARIFKWYASNFKLDFGVLEKSEKFSDEEDAVIRFLAYYSDAVDKVQYLESRKYKIKYMPFDWSLNDWRRTG